LKTILKHFISLFNCAYWFRFATRIPIGRLAASSCP